MLIILLKGSIRSLFLNMHELRLTRENIAQHIYIFNVFIQSFLALHYGE